MDKLKIKNSVISAFFSFRGMYLWAYAGLCIWIYGNVFHVLFAVPLFISAFLFQFKELEKNPKEKLIFSVGDGLYAAIVAIFLLLGRYPT